MTRKYCCTLLRCVVGQNQKKTCHESQNTQTAHWNSSRFDLPSDRRRRDWFGPRLLYKRLINCVNKWNSFLRWCYTRRFATTIFSAKQLATLLQHCFEWLQDCFNIAKLCCAKTHRCESSRVTSPLVCFAMASSYWATTSRRVIQSSPALRTPT